MMKGTDTNRTAKDTALFSIPPAARRILCGKSFTLTAICLVLAFVLLAPGGFAEEPANGKTVRVGWYESAFNYQDQFGRRFGYAYEYQQKIAAYTGWSYEYVEGTWPELLHMLEAGEIDLLSDVSYTQERKENMLFSSLPMGTETYYVFISSSNSEITPENMDSFNGKRVGVNESSVQAGMFLEWAAKNGVKTELVELAISEEEWMRMLNSGEIDAYVAIDTYGSRETCVPVCKIGQSDFYFTVCNERHDLLAELNDAMNRIQDENRYYNQQMFDQYMRASGANAFLSSDEVNWLSEHGTIRVGYRAGFLPFCDIDMTTGEFTGALNDYFELAANCLRNAEIEFVPIAYATVDAALKALQNGEIDCVFPVNLSSYDGEERGLIATSPLMRTELYAVVKNADREGLSPQQQKTAAVITGDINSEGFIKDYFPAWKIIYLDGIEECYRAVRGGEADCFMISNYRVASMESLQDQYNLFTIATGKTMNQAIAVRRGDGFLYSILNKTIGLIPSASMDAALTNYSYPNEKSVSVSKFLHDNTGSVIFVIIAVSILIILLLLQSLKNAKRANEGEQLISATEIDPLTALYNKSYFFEYAAKMYRENPSRAMDAIVLDVEQFRSVNALKGREFGDFVLRLLGGEIRSFLREMEGIATRFDGDRFDIYCEHMDDYQYLFERIQNKLNELSGNANIRVYMGVMPWQAGVEPGVQFDRAWSACNMARKSFHTRLLVYNQKMRDKELQEQRLLNDLRRAVQDHEFEVYYQPKYNVQGSTPTLCSAEALVRWRHPELGLIPPDQFVPLLERNGQINLVDHYVWAEVAKQIALWREQYGITVPVSVNLSRLDVFDPTLENTLEELVEKNGLERRTLKLEVTESAYTDNAEQLMVLVERLRKKGYEIEMDDFGTGYSSLNMLSSMPVDVLKMDKAFIQNIKDDKDIHLVQLILDIAKTLNVPVVAEGVETESQMMMLKELGCALVQGYYFSHPMPPETFGEGILGKMEASGA